MNLLDQVFSVFSNYSLMLIAYYFLPAVLFLSTCSFDGNTKIVNIVKDLEEDIIPQKINIDDLRAKFKTSFYMFGAIAFAMSLSCLVMLFFIPENQDSLAFKSLFVIIMLMYFCTIGLFARFGVESLKLETLLPLPSFYEKSAVKLITENKHIPEIEEYIKINNRSSLLAIDYLYLKYILENHEDKTHKDAMKAINSIIGSKAEI